MPAEEFFVGVYVTAVGEGELLTKVSVPPSAGAGDGFSGVTIGVHGTYIANAAATVSDDGVRVALGCVDAVPVRATAMEEKLAGGDLSEESVRAAAEGLGATLDPPSDAHGSADYRRRLAEVSAVAGGAAGAYRGGRRERSRPQSHDLGRRQRRADRVRRPRRGASSSTSCATTSASPGRTSAATPGTAAPARCT